MTLLGHRTKESSFRVLRRIRKWSIWTKYKKCLKRDVHILYVKSVQDIYNTNKLVYNKVHDNKIQKHFILRNCWIILAQVFDFVGPGILSYRDGIESLCFTLKCLHRHSILICFCFNHNDRIKYQFLNKHISVKV